MMMYPMRVRQFVLLCPIVLVVGSSLYGQQTSQTKTTKAYPPTLAGSRVEVYKKIGDVRLQAYIYSPVDHKPGDDRPVAVFFFGGGWRAGTPAQFMEHCKHLASRGMVAIAVDYRVSSRHQTKAVDCVSDAKSAIRWVRENHQRLGVDPKRVLAGGGSAGGHLAACTAVVEKYDETTENLRISSIPNGLALFNPALVLAPIKGANPLDAERMAGLPGGAKIRNVMQIERDKANVETWYFEMPFPFIARQLEESAEGRSVDVVHRLARRLTAPRPYLFVMVAKCGHERRRPEQFRIAVDQAGVGFHAIFDSRTTKLMRV